MLAVAALKSLRLAEDAVREQAAVIRAKKNRGYGCAAHSTSSEAEGPSKTLAHAARKARDRKKGRS